MNKIEITGIVACEIDQDDKRFKVTDEHRELIIELLKKIVLKDRFCFSPTKLKAHLHKEIFKGDNQKWISLNLVAPTNKYKSVSLNTLGRWSIQRMETFDNQIEIVFVVDLK